MKCKTKTILHVCSCLLKPPKNTKKVCRALGLPARPVSNLVSAHDTNGTFTIDRFFDEKGNAMDIDPFNPGGETDSIWNFHVWVEAWMARPDLPKGNSCDVVFKKTRMLLYV